MSQLTKKAIVEATLSLAQTRPISKITVRDIVEECGITRNTFYYHFHDIYEVLEDVIDAKFDALEGTWVAEPSHATRELLAFFAEYKRILLNLYRAIGHEALADYLRRRIRGILLERISVEFSPLSLLGRDAEILCAFCEEAMVGLLLRWLKEDSEIFEASEQIEQLFDGAIRAFVEKYAQDPSKKG